jgi:hypothetical protein
VNAAHLHLILNHVPILAAIGGVALFGYGLLRCSRDLTRAALAVMVLGAVTAVPVYLSGEPAEEQVEHAVAIAETDIERHEQSAKVSMALVAGLGLAALAGLLFPRRKLEQGWFPMGLLIVGLLTSIHLVWTGHLGGRIRHPEIGASVAANQVESEPEGTEERESR